MAIGVELSKVSFSYSETRWEKMCAPGRCLEGVDGISALSLGNRKAEELCYR